MFLYNKTLEMGCVELIY